jgi:hypothetical protein
MRHRPAASRARRIRGRDRGSVVLPGPPDYELVSKPTWPQYEDVRPAAVVLCATPPDVAETSGSGANRFTLLDHPLFVCSRSARRLSVPDCVA